MSARYDEVCGLIQRSDDSKGTLIEINRGGFGGRLNLKSIRSITVPTQIALMLIMDLEERIQTRRETRQLRTQLRTWEKKYWEYHYIIRDPKLFPSPTVEIWQKLVCDHFDLESGIRSVQRDLVRRQLEHAKDNPYIILSPDKRSAVERRELQKKIDRLNRYECSDSFVKKDLAEWFAAKPTRAYHCDPDDDDWPDVPAYAPVVIRHDPRIFAYTKKLAKKYGTHKTAHSKLRDAVRRAVGMLGKVKAKKFPGNFAPL